MNRFYILLTIFLSFSTLAAEDWIKIAETDDTLWEGRAGSRIPATTKSGKEISVASGRIFDRKEKRFDFVKWYVSVEDCYNGYGKLVTLNMQGEYRFENDFVEKGGSVASSLASMLCYPLLEEKREKAGKGI